MNSLFSNFTNLYELSKTLRFELKPIGKTLEKMREHLQYDRNLQTFLADQDIEDAYQTLKPLFDYLHKEFITGSLESETARNIDFYGYLKEYRNNKEVKGKNKNLENIEKLLRNALAETYQNAAKSLKEKAGKDEREKDILTEKGYKILTEKGILEYIRRDASKFSEIKSEKEILEALKVFKGFFTYFGGFNQNRENYYETGKESSTAVATRIVHENLPKFCDNILIFNNRLIEYKNAYNNLQKLKKTLVNKENEPLSPISEDIFKIKHFNQCLSQKQIEKYNEQIGNANFLINLYNQAKKEEMGFKRLPLFKTLYKQIGCGEKDVLFFTLNCDKKDEAEKIRKKGKESHSVQEVLVSAKKAGEKYFRRKSEDGMIDTVPEFLEYIKNREDYRGIYWSKAAINTISNKYFANWHDLKDKLKEEKVFEKIKKESEEDVKIPDAIELESLFQVLNKIQNWEKSGIFFKQDFTEKRKKIIEDTHTPSEALLRLILDDITNYAQNFLKESEKILTLTEYKSKKSKEAIKSCFDHALATNQMLKYFLVKESKVKGNPIDSTLSQALEILLRSDDAEWFKWYNSLRNYLTKKPQDDAKKNKLKLNFENGSLLGGWSDGQEKIKAAVLFKKDRLYYLGILKKKSLFDTTKKDNAVYKNTDSENGRLILTNLKFQTLAGKGFLGKFGKSYSNMGKENPLEAIKCLQIIIKDRYVKKYPLLETLLKKSYKDKREFDKEIQKILVNCYVCEFIPINWNEIEKHINLGDIYLFKLHSKDFSEKNNGKKDLQTLYWNTVFEKNSQFQLNGGGEIFYRRQVIQEKDKKIKKGYEQKKEFVIENKRFTKDKFLFHCPIKLNYKDKSYSKPKFAFSEINKVINKNFSKNENPYFLGIDRGEKHLAYYSLVNTDGKIKDQGTLNIPFVDKNGNPRTIKAEKQTIKNGKEQVETIECKDYNELLEARSGNRDYARKNWQTISNIKELKEGYISQVVRKIAELAIKQPTFIVLENLSTEFKRGRQKIEKSVYQKFELALAKKLNFLVNKTAKNGEVGSVTKALQLTPPVANYGDIENKKQVGIIFYTRANYTSQTDPATGWRKSIYLKKGSEENIKKQIIDKFSEIGFDGKDYFFVYTDENTSKQWILYAGKNGKSLDRFRGKRGIDKNEWTIEKKDIVKILDGVFVNFDKNRSLISQIEEGIELSKENNEHTAWESLRFAIDLIQQIRNTGQIKQDSDFILSPIRDNQNNHFDSRKVNEKQPNSGDANGAYNIARKGIIMYEHIKRKYGLFVSDMEWDTWLSGKEVWAKWIKNNQDILQMKKLKV